MDIPRLKFWRYAKSLENMSAGDRFFSVVIEKIRFTIFSSFISDIFLFSLNELARYDFRVDQSNHSGMSYIVVFACFSLGVYDTIRMIRINQDYITSKEKNLSSKLSLDESGMNLNQSMNEENNSVGSQDALIGNNEGRQRIGTAIPVLPSRVEIVANKEERVKKYQSHVEYFEQGMQGEKLGDIGSKYYNCLALVRLLAFEPFIVSLQLFPVFQVFSVFIIQGLFFLYTMNLIFKKKAFSHWVFTWNFFINETFFFIFLCVCCYLALVDPKSFDSKKYQTFQIWVVSLIILIAAINVFIFVANLFVSIQNLINAMKKKKKEQTDLRKTFLENYNTSGANQSRQVRGITRFGEHEEIHERSIEEESDEDEKEKSGGNNQNDDRGSDGSLGKLIRNANRPSLARRDSQMKRDFRNKLKEEEQRESKFRREESIIDIGESYIGDINPNIVVDESKKKKRRRKKKKNEMKGDKEGSNSDPKLKKRREDKQKGSGNKKRSKSDAQDLF